MARASTKRIRTGVVKVDGLRELDAALKSLGPELRKELRSANKSVATLVADDARAAAYSIGGVAAHVAPSIKASAGVQSAGVAIGGPAYPMAGGAEFGAGQDRLRDRRTGQYVGYRQFEPWRGNSTDAGYFLYPAIRQDADRIVTEYTAALDAVMRKAGLE